MLGIKQIADTEKESTKQPECNTGFSEKNLFRSKTKIFKIFRAFPMKKENRKQKTRKLRNSSVVAKLTNLLLIMNLPCAKRPKAQLS